MAILTWLQPADIQYGTSLGNTQLDATANVAGVFIYTPSPGTILDVGASQVLSATFYPADASSTQTVSTIINVTKLSPPISWTTPADISIGTALSPTQLNATSILPGTFIYTPAIGTVLNVGQHTLNVVFVPTDTVNVNSSTSSVQINVIDVLLSMTLSPEVISIVVSSFGESSGQQVVITGSFLSGTTQGITNLVSYTSSNSAISYTNGLISINQPGTYTITFTYQNVSSTYTIEGIATSPTSDNVVNPVFFRSHLTQELLNYFDKNDNRVRENPFTIDAQLLTLAAVGLESIQLKLDRETQVNLNSPCNIDNGGVYYAFTNPQADLTSITTVTGLVSGSQTVFTEYDDSLPIPANVSISSNTYPLNNPVLVTITGSGILQNVTIGILPYPEKLTFSITGSANTLPNLDIAITGYRYPKPLWIVDQELYTEAVTVNSIGVYSTINKWAEVTNICIRGLVTGYNINCYGHTFTMPYRPDEFRPVTTPSQRFSKFPRYWFNNPTTQDVFELKVENSLAGFDHVQSYKSSLGIVDLDIEPNTYGLIAVSPSNIYYIDRREAMPLATNAMAISIDPIIGIKIERDFNNSSGFVKINIVPMLYPNSNKLMQYRVFFQDPNGIVTIITPEGLLLDYATQSGWRTELFTSMSCILPVVGSYTFTIQSQDQLGNITTDSFLHYNLGLSPLASIPLSGIVPLGVCFDSDDRLWVWDGTTATQLNLVYNNYVADTNSNILYLTIDADGVAIT